MKSVTEFSGLKLADGIKAKAALTAEGKTPEEVTTSLGEQFKFADEKLKCFVTAVEIAEKFTEKLFVVKVSKLNEGQNPPPQGKVIEDLCYVAVPFPNLNEKKAEAPVANANAKGGGRPGNRGGGKPGGKGGGKPKDSPWGISPEEKEAKLAAARQAAREKSLAGKS